MGTNYKGTKKEIRALDTYIKFMRAAESISSRAHISLSGTGLTESQFNVLDALYHLGPLPQKELGRKLLKTDGNITMVIDNLEKAQLVERKRGKNDRRQYYVHLTRKGKNHIGNILPGQLEFIVNEMAVLSHAEQMELQALCKKIGIRKK